MNRVEHLLSNLAEECVEVAQRATKAQRFSLTEIQPGQPFTNAERIMHEYADILAVLDVLFEEGHLKWPDDQVERIQAKKDRMELMLKRSKESGAYSETVSADHQLKMLEHQNEVLHRWNHEAQAELVRYRKALEFYAKGNHTYSHPENAVSDYHWDNGGRAKKALSPAQPGNEDEHS